eukprot:533938-Alexandrium_andersonii.AAC.1
MCGTTHCSHPSGGLPRPVVWEMAPPAAAFFSLQTALEARASRPTGHQDEYPSVQLCAGAGVHVCPTAERSCVLTPDQPQDAVKAPVTMEVNEADNSVEGAGLDWPVDT